MKTLQRWELVEEVDRGHVGGGSRAIVWELTDRGEEFIAEGGLESGRRVARADDIEQLTQRVDGLESNMDYIRGVVMRIAVNTGTLEKEEAREAMGDERFRDVFGEA